MTIGDVGGTNDNTLANMPFGSLMMFRHAIMGTTHIRMTGLSKLCVSLIVLQIEPIPTMNAPNMKKART